MKKAKETLVSFWDEMHKWEVRTHERYKPENGGPEANREVAKSELIKIYDDFLTEKERKTGRLAGPDAGYPPEYDPINESVIDIVEESNKVIFETKWKHPVSDFFDERHKFTLKKSIGGVEAR
ncbi:hypothetical protein E8K88_17715 [Lampropedia aestuarii]|uniref:NTF2 fold immunity protein domain-containing protein n=1 Tax=Lampropedia aestuarii TaxID=2562762 RepID=A0A4S5BI70_9BURK|nr:NTF2 fold immunity protein [Lampropedia aestuarii]THJ30475.1 hypothetical protein E8K88_17715 [Lampropedia aestuarii]